MTIANWSLYFDLVQDKYGAPYFIDQWKSLFFNRATIDFVNSHFPEDNNKNSGFNIEENQDTLKALAPIIVTIYPANMNTSGKLLKTSLNTYLQNATGVSSDTVMRILKFIWWTTVSGTEGINSGTNVGQPIKVMRHNDWGQFLINVFKKPSTTNPRWYETYDAYNFSPVSATTNLSVSVLKYPKTVDVATNVESDLPDFTHNEIIARALSIAGVASRDEALAQLLAVQQQQK